MTMTAKDHPSLLLKVNNSNQLESGCTASHLFGPEGGLVGSETTCLWRIQDGQQGIAPEHFAITLRDGAFCLSPMSEGVLINGASPEELREVIRLQQGDEIRVGLLLIKTFISLNGEPVDDPLLVSPESLVIHHGNPLESLLDKKKPENSYAPTVQDSFHPRRQDPLDVLQSEILHQPDAKGNTLSVNSVDELMDTKNPRRSAPAFSFLEQSDDSAMDRDFIELPQVNYTQPAAELTPEEMADRFVAITPLMRGLSVPLALRDSQQVNDFLEEAGRTLQAAVRGLLALQRQQKALTDKHLRPLEDNPLRLNLDYTTTLDVLFADGKSPVHLSAPEAVAECLHNLRLHHQANQAAIGEALTVMLDAFSPARLLTRFERYRRSADREEMNAARAWEMYCRYYEELTSSRQQGFNKLFDEVYEQAYDRALRQGERESQ